ncbi:efflux transporter outer membrane subunit [Paraburkholderia phenazinium]|uniref:Efflux transporter, outer membrane factor (OMF) lipoprotein, NodT family n=1 Tax=Paraburkholderia phenazinium TaxID=60549 RepID=A0A1G8JH55_9BURK|nr:efflux transporter outer membrane subunit [Paraburkholderia phenazinium]SDI30506.1 efflux transporter, outer membrane factor (OMF) lipoprotein, NodT family [Paraburkholderia phenazinium]
MKLAYKTSVLAVATALALTGCSFGPSGEPPAMPSPEYYGAQAQPSKTVAAGGIAQRFDIGATSVPQWWRLYRSDALDALVEEGLRNSPTLAATQRTLSAAQEELRGQIGSSTLPSVDAAAQVERARSPVVPGIGPSEVRYNFFAGQIQTHYTFDLFGATRYANAAAAARVNVQAYELEAARRALAANIVGTAINVAALDRQIALSERLVAVASETANDDQQRYVLGSISHVQALNSTQDSDLIAASLPALRQQRISALHALAVLMGRTPDNAPTVPDFDSMALPDQVPVVVPSDLLRSRPDIQAADAAVKAAAADVGAATAQLFPSLSLTASMGRGGFSWPAMLSGAGGLWEIGAGLSQPLFHGGALFAQRRASIDTYDAAVLHYKSTVLSAFQDVADSLAALDNDAQMLALTERAAQAAHAAFEETASRTRLGSLPSTAQHASEQRLLNAQLGAVRAGSQRMSDTAALFQAMGELQDDQPHMTSRE